MMNYQNPTYMTQNQTRMGGRQMFPEDWSSEISDPTAMAADTDPAPGVRSGNMAGNTGLGGSSGMMGGAGMMGDPSMMGSTGLMGSAGMDSRPGTTLDMRNNLPSEVINSPTSMNEAYLGSLKAMLGRNVGNYIVATFLVGTQNTVSWEGILYDVGNDYVTIYQEGRDRYIVSDIYSLKYMEFYDTRRREMCDQLMQERGML